MDNPPKPQPERVVLSECLVELSKQGARVFRNNTGLLYDKNGTPVKFGLCVGSSDIIGIYKGRFLAVEIKATGKRVKPDGAQDKFIRMIREQGGIAFECDNARNIKKLLDDHS